MTTTPSTRVIGSWYSTSSPPSEPASTASATNTAVNPATNSATPSSTRLRARGGPDERVALRERRVWADPVIPPR